MTNKDDTVKQNEKDRLGQKEQGQQRNQDGYNKQNDKTHQDPSKKVPTGK